MALNSADIGLMAVQKLVDVMRSGTTKSLVEYTKNCRAEPLVMLDSECVFIEEMYDVMQSLQSQYAAYYLLAMSMMTTINNAQVSQHMSRLNPSRSVVDSIANSASAAGGYLIAAEAFSDALPSVGRMLGSQATRDDERNVDVPVAGAGRNAVKEVSELSNLSVGKIITTQITDGRTSVEVPIAIRLIASSIPSESLVHILNGQLGETNWKERFHAWRSGRLSTADMLFCNDLVDAYYKNGMKDDTGLFREMVNRRTKNRLAGLFSANPSVGTYSNMAVLTETSAKELEYSMGGKRLSDFKAREALFDKTALMILAVVDRNWKRVTFYHQSISRPTEVSFRDLKTSNKGTGPDVSEILAAYRVGQAPVL